MKHRPKPKRAAHTSEKSERSRPSQTTRTSQSPPVAVALAVFAAVAALALALWWWPNRGHRLGASVPIPEVSLTGLAPEAARLIQAQMDEVRRSPGQGERWGRLGGILKSCGFPTEAATCLAEAGRLSPRDPRWPYLRGSLPGEDSIALWRRAAELAGRTPEIPRLRLARALFEAGRWDEARAVAEGVLRDTVDCPPALLLLAQVHQARGEWAAAVEQARACADSPMTGRAAATLLAVAQRRLGDPAAAERAARQAAARPPDVSWPDPYEEEVLGWRNDPRSLSDRAQAHLLGGRPEAALPLIDRLVRNHPDFAETWLLLGRVQYLRKQPAEAEATLRKHLAMDPSSVNGHFQLGMSLLAQQKLAEAAESFRQAIALKADSGPAWFNLGFVLARLGRTRDAVEPFRQAIRHNPEKIDSYFLLADLHVQLGEPEEAARLAGLAAQIDPDDRRLPVLRQKIGQ